MNQPFKRCCANCASFDAAEQCCDNAVTFIDPVTRQYRPRVPDDDCCHDHERKPPQLRIVPGGLQGSDA